MSPRSRFVALAGVALAALALALVALLGDTSGGPGHGAGETSTEASSADVASATGFDGALLPAGRPPRGFALVDQNGRSVSLRGLRGRVVILSFLYSSSRGTAPLIAQQIRGALDELEPHAAAAQSRHPRAPGTPIPPGAAALAVSVDPAADTAGHVRAFLRKTSLTGRLQYLTGPAPRLRAVWRAYGVVPASAGESAYERAAFVVLLDRAGAPRVELPLEQLTPEGLAHDVRRLESAPATAGGAADG